LLFGNLLNLLKIEWVNLCVANEEWRLELSAEGELIIMPPTAAKAGLEMLT
jgi:Uma2 family endonuclease